MAFTYDLATDVGKVRLELGDTDSAAALFVDEEITYKLGERAGNLLLTAADLCGILARRFAGEYDFATDGQSFKRGSRSGMYADRERDLRERAGGGVAVLATTKVDGYTDDLSSRDGSGQASSRRGRVRRGYFDPDLPY